LGDLLISLKFITNLCERDLTLKLFLEQLCIGIKKYSLGLFNIDVILDSKDNTIKIIDTNFSDNMINKSENTNEFVKHIFRLFDKNQKVRSYSCETDLSSDLIAAMAQQNLIAKDRLDSMQAAADEKFGENKSEYKENQSSEEDTQKEREKAVGLYNNNYSGTDKTIVIDEKYWPYIKDEILRKAALSEKSKIKKREELSFALRIPLSINVTIDGTNNYKIGDLYSVKGITEIYDKYTFYIVKLKHSIQKAD